MKKTIIVSGLTENIARHEATIYNSGQKGKPFCIERIDIEKNVKSSDKIWQVFTYSEDQSVLNWAQVLAKLACEDNCK